MIYLVLGALGIFLVSQAPKAVDAVEGMILRESDNWTRFDALFKKYGAVNNVDWLVLKAIAMNESSLGSVKSVALGLVNPSDIEGSKSQDGLSWGLMQVTVTTAKDLDPSATAQKLNDPEYSVRLAAQYLGRLQKRFNMLETRWLEWVVKSYNQGPGNTDKERKGLIDGYANEYWARFERNYERASA